MNGGTSMLERMKNRAVEALAASPIARRILADQADVVLAHRRQLAAQLVDVRAKVESQIPKLDGAIAAAEKKAAAAKAVFDGAVEELRQARQARGAAASALQGAEYALAAELRATAAPEIDEFITELRDSGHELRTLDASVQTVQSKRNIEGESRPTLLGGTLPSVNRRAKALHEAIHQAEDLKLQALSDEDLAKRIAEIRAGLPVVAFETWAPPAA